MTQEIRTYSPHPDTDETWPPLEVRLEHEKATRRERVARLTAETERLFPGDAATDIRAGIQQKGFSRIPIMHSDRVDQERTELPIGYVLSKHILALPSEDLEKTIGDLVKEKPDILQQAKFFYTSERATVYDVYKHMLENQAKMSFVIDQDSLEIREIITFEDVLEFLAQREILDENDVQAGNEREHEAEIQERYKDLRAQFEQRASKIPLAHS